MDDRRPARYFHGRKREWQLFEARLQNTAAAGRGGSIVLVQGAPGAGKSALLHEFGNRAAGMKWRVLHDLDCESLYNPSALAHAAGERYSCAEAHARQVGLGADTLVPPVESASIGGGGTRPQPYNTAAVKAVAQRLVRRNDAGLLLIIDEVQNASFIRMERDREIASNMLNWIHNGRANVPVILLAGGLGHSKEVLQLFGITRLMANGGLINLGGLSRSAERLVLRDWMVNYGGARPSPRLERWITAIAKETDRWPQHIQCYASLAATWLHRHGGALTPEVPAEVMDAGMKLRETFYAHRVDSIDWSYCVALAELVSKADPRPRFARRDIVRAFMQADIPDLITNEWRAKAAGKAFELALEKGVLSLESPGCYRIPIRSMQRWLVQTSAERGSPRVYYE